MNSGRDFDYCRIEKNGKQTLLRVLKDQSHLAALGKPVSQSKQITEKTFTLTPANQILTTTRKQRQQQPNKKLTQNSARIQNLNSHQVNSNLKSLKF